MDRSRKRKLVGSLVVMITLLTVFFLEDEGESDELKSSAKKMRLNCDEILGAEFTADRRMGSEKQFWDLLNDGDPEDWYKDYRRNIFQDYLWYSVPDWDH